MTTIDQKIAEYLNDWTPGGWPLGNFFLCVIALTLATLSCGAIGIEREKRGRTAGLRTHLLVGVGSCIIMIISIYGFPGSFSEKRDVARLAAQVIAGVGFLGAGAIIHRNSNTRGLTTAATIWIVMAIGLACGSMNFILAVGGTILILTVLTAFRKTEARINKKNPMIVLHAKKDVPIVSVILEKTKFYDGTVRELFTEIDDNDNLEITFLVSGNSEKFAPFDLVSALETCEGVKDAYILNKSK